MVCLLYNRCIGVLCTCSNLGWPSGTSGGVRKIGEEMALGLSPPQSYGRTPSTATARACRQMMDLSPDASFLLATPKKRTHHRILTPGSPSTCRLLQQRYEKKLWENLVKPQSVPEELRPHRVLSAPSMQVTLIPDRVV